MEEKKTYEELEERIKELEGQVKGTGNREYKSRLFSFIFGREENKPWTLSLYNALHGTSHEDISSITINTIEDVVYMGMKNDLSILVSETVSLYKGMELYEQQSTYNPNMPVREFMYAGKLYDKYIHTSRLNRYGKKLLPLPLPKLVVFYNGEEAAEDEAILSLSESYKEEIRKNVKHRYEVQNESVEEAQVAAEVEEIYQKADPDIEVRVRMVNINHGHNRKMLTACRPLGEYAWFVAQVRENLKKEGIEAIGIGEAIEKAIEEMPEEFEIKPYITANRAEVKDMCLTEYNEAETMEMLRQEGLEEGLQRGKQEGLEEGLQRGWQKTMLLNIKNLKEGTGWTEEKVMDVLKIPQEQRRILKIEQTKNR